MTQVRSKFQLLFVCIAFLMAMPALGQGYKARITGHITDTAGAVVLNATVTATNVDTGIRTHSATTADGEYVIPELSPGNYTVTVEAQGFQKYLRAGVTLNADSVVRVDATLTVGSVTQQITVTEQVPVINTETPTLGETISNHEILDIPLNGRNYLNLALLSPGVAPAAAGSNPDVINGSRPDHVDYLLDGVSNVAKRGNNPVVQPSIDAIQEYTLLSNDFSAVYGRLGGGIISVALKSGTNKFHGSAYDFLRNTVMDGFNYFATSNPALHQNQFGGTLGGPIIRDKTFFFFSYEGLRNSSQQTSLSAVPTDPERTGLFPTPVYDPYTKAYYPGNQVTNISPIATNLLSFVPHANASGAYNYVSLGSAQANTNNYLIKIDHQLTPNSRLSGHYMGGGTFATSPFAGSSLPGFGSSEHQPQQQAALDFTRTFNASVVNDVRFAFSRMNFQNTSVNYGKNTSSDVGITGVAPGTGLAQVTMVGLLSFGDANSLPDVWTDNEYSFNDSLNIVRGNHYFQVGGDYERSQHFNQYAAFTNGLLAFYGTFTKNVIADFLIGVPLASEQQVGTTRSYLFSNYLGFYMQDDWKVLPSLTLNLGLRWDFNPPASEKYGNWGNFIPSVGKTVVSGTQGYPRSVLQTQYTNFSPRVGFAYRLPDQKTVLRGGYGIFTAYDLQYTEYELLASNQYPFAKILLYEEPNGSLSLGNAFPTAGGAAQGASTPNGWDYQNPTSYTQQWNLTLARDLSHNIGVQVSYVGTTGAHLSALEYLNQPTRTPTGSISPFPSYSRIDYVNLEANSNYNALQLSVQKRFSGGLSFKSNFTWSKSIDDASYVGTQFVVLDPNDFSLDRGLSADNRGRIWSNDFIYQLPIGRGRRFGNRWNQVTDAVLGGWQMNGIMEFISGLPFTPLVSSANQLLGQSPRPNRIGSGVLAHPTLQKWFDTSAFVPLASTDYGFGDSGRDILIGPGYAEVDASVFKEFALPWEGNFLQLRGECFNLPNHPNFGQPSPYIDQSTGGVIHSAAAPREMQVALRYYF